MSSGFKQTKTLTITDWRDDGSRLPSGQYIGRRDNKNSRKTINGVRQGFIYDQFTGADLMREIEESAGHIHVDVSQDARRKVFRNRPGAFRAGIVQQFLKELEQKQVETAQ